MQRPPTKRNEEKNNCNIEENEKKLIAYALIQSNNNNTNAAKLLGISRDTLIRKKKKYNIAPNVYHSLTNQTKYF